MHLLSLDFGTKRIGLAWSDTTLGAILPFGVIDGKSNVEKITKLVKLLKEENIDRVIVGYPLNLKGEENKNTERIKSFAFEIQKQLDIPIEYVDERFSSHGADSMGEGVTRDERSAMFILEGYVETLKHQKQ